jgi:hypothetical protein
MNQEELMLRIVDALDLVAAELERLVLLKSAYLSLFAFASVHRSSPSLL